MPDKITELFITIILDHKFYKIYMYIFILWLAVSISLLIVAFFDKKTKRNMFDFKAFSILNVLCILLVLSVFFLHKKGSDLVDMYVHYKIATDCEISIYAPDIDDKKNMLDFLKTKEYEEMRFLLENNNDEEFELYFENLRINSCKKTNKDKRRKSYGNGKR